MTKVAIANAKSTTIFEWEVLTVIADDTPIHTRDFVEIEPVRLEDGQIETVYEDAARSPVRTKVEGPGDLRINKNAAYVPGAYVNLRHHQARKVLETYGLELAPGITHIIPAGLTPMMRLSYDIETDGAGNIVSDRDAMAMGAALVEASQAAVLGNVGHIAIRIR